MVQKFEKIVKVLTLKGTTVVPMLFSDLDILLNFQNNFLLYFFNFIGSKPFLNLSLEGRRWTMYLLKLM